VVALSVVNFAVLTAGGAVVAAATPSWRTVAATLVGGVNGLLWALAVPAAVLFPSVHWRRVPVTPIVAAIVVGLIFIVGGVTSAGQAKKTAADPPAIGGVEARAIRQPVIFISGYNSSYDGRSDPTPPIVRYSYRGLFPNGRPRPYTAQDTHQSLLTSSRRLANQVEQVHAATGQKVALLAVSEGSLVSQFYMETVVENTKNHPVDAVVLLSPVLRGGRVYYPPRDRKVGWGLATGWELRGIFAVLGVRTGLPNSADQPLIRSLLEDAPLFRGKQVLCPVDGVRMIAFLPTLDGAAVPPSAAGGAEIPTIHILDTHGALVDRPATRRRLVDFLNANRSSTEHRWDYTAAQYAGAAWQTPALKTSLNPVWNMVAGHSTRNLKITKCI
jgi:pimeloyl-ACP methyl ester carboxylesterase